MKRADSVTQWDHRYEYKFILALKRTFSNYQPPRCYLFPKIHVEHCKLPVLPAHPSKYSYLLPLMFPNIRPREKYISIREGDLKMLNYPLTHF